MSAPRAFLNLVFLCALGSGLAARGEVVAELDPPHVTVSPGDQFTTRLKLTAWNLNTVGAYSILLQYDPAIVRIEDVAVASSSPFKNQALADRSSFSSGATRLVAFRDAPAGLGPSATSLASIHWRAIGPTTNAAPITARFEGLVDARWLPIEAWSLPAVATVTRAAALKYAGVLSDDHGYAVGLVQATVGRLDTVSGTLYLGGVPVVFSGAFDSQRVFTRVIRRPGRPALRITLQIDSNGNVLSGTVSDGKKSWRIEATRNSPSFAADQPKPAAGRYTLSFPLGSVHVGDTTCPQGAGFGLASLSSGGSIRCIGRLGDRIPFSFAAAVDAAGGFPISCPLPYARPGSLNGTMKFRDNGAGIDADGTAVWVKPLQSAGRYPAGFSVSLAPFAARYAGVGPGVDATLTLSGGGLSTALTKTVALPVHSGAITVQPAGDDALALTFNEKSGFVSGSFVPGPLATPADASPRFIQGVLLTPQLKARGFFVGALESGNFQLEWGP